MAALSMIIVVAMATSTVGIRAIAWKKNE